jgi:hypothetical protein
MPVEESAYFQHLALTHIAQTLTDEVEIYVQDPLYDDLAKALLGERGARYKCNLQVVNDSDGISRWTRALFS